MSANEKIFIFLGPNESNQSCAPQIYCSVFDGTFLNILKVVFVIMERNVCFVCWLRAGRFSESQLAVGSANLLNPSIHFHPFAQTPCFHSSLTLQKHTPLFKSNNSSNTRANKMQIWIAKHILMKMYGAESLASNAWFSLLICFDLHLFRCFMRVYNQGYRVTKNSGQHHICMILASLFNWGLTSLINLQV
jgi:hypothetical protein